MSFTRFFVSSMTNGIQLAQYQKKPFIYIGWVRVHAEENWLDCDRVCSWSFSGTLEFPIWSLFHSTHGAPPRLARKGDPGGSLEVTLARSLNRNATLWGRRYLAHFRDFQQGPPAYCGWVGVVTGGFWQVLGSRSRPTWSWPPWLSTQWSMTGWSKALVFSANIMHVY